MKHYTFIAAAFAAAAITASCAKEFSPEQEAPATAGVTYVSVGGQSFTRTVLGTPGEQGVRKVYWQNGDRLNINGVASEPLEGIGEGVGSAVFEFKAVLDHPYDVLYPASAWKDAATVTLPATQVYTEGSFDPAAAVTLAYAAASGSGINMKSPCSVLKLTITAGTDSCTLKTLTFSGNASEQVCGDFTADYQAVTLTGASSAAADKKVKVDVSALTLDSEGKEVYVVVPAGTYASGFTFRLSDVKGHYMDKAKAASVTLESGKVYAMPSFAYAPTGTLIEIGSAQEYVDFVSAYNSGDYGTKDAGLTVEITDTLDFSGLTFKTLGNNNYDFSGTWHGNGFPMKNITVANESLFYVPVNASFSGIVIDKSCSFTRTGTGSGHWGIISRTIDSGSISDCDINCDWKMDYPSGGFTYGSLCGRLNGTMTNCHMNGSLIYERTVTTKVTNWVKIGGLVGMVNTSGKMTGCSTTGDVIFNEPTADKRPTCTTKDKYFGVGGLVGYNLGKVSGCKMTGNLVYSDCPQDAFVGGVVGDSSSGITEDCTMEGNVKAFQTAANTTDYQRLYVGGVIGRACNASTVKNCSTKTGTTMEFGSAANMINVGGVVATVMHTTVVDNCVNNMTVIQKTYAPGSGLYGGIVGNFSGGTLSNLENKADIKIGRYSNASSAKVACGGVIGWQGAAVSGTVTAGKSTIHNSGMIFTDAMDTTCTGFAAAGFGGVVGIQTAGDITGVTNSGLVHLSYNNHKSTTKPIKNVFAGGIVGDISAACTLSGCLNSGIVKVESWPAATTGRVIALGGIVGAVTPYSKRSTGVSGVNIKDCTFTGVLWSTNNNNACPAWQYGSGKFEGGIVGGVCGVGTSYTNIENCTCAASSSYNYNAYGHQGGIIGGAMYANIKNCTVKSTLQGFKDQAKKRGINISGIASYARYTTITGCKIDGVKVNYCYNFAGICYEANANTVSPISDNTVNVTLTASEINTWYMLTKNTNASSVIQNNGVKGSVNGVTLTADNVKYCGGSFTCDSSKPNYIITD